MQAARGTAITNSDGGPQSDGKARPRARFRIVFAAVLLAGVALDVLTKIIAVAQLDPQNPVVLFGGLLRLQLIRNPGAAFSLGENFTVVFAILSGLVLIFVVFVLARRLGHYGWAVALGLLGAGVGGNFVDRIFRDPGPFRGHVVDFLQLPRWPIFNVADMCITSAAVLIMILSVIKNVAINGDRYEKPGTSSPDEADDDSPDPKTIT